MKKIVRVLNIPSYNKEVIRSRLNEVIDNWFPDIFSHGDKVLLKPNLLMASSPDMAITTHPAIVETVGEIFQGKGCKVYIADNSPGFNTNSSDMDYVYRETGMYEIAQRRGFTILHSERSRIVDGIPFSWWTEGFKIVNLPKLKTHSIMVLTAATKNLYGCISGIYKSYLHKIYPRTDDLAGVILKLYRLIKPVVTIVDGIVSLEGEGPAKNGQPRNTGFVVVGNDTLSTDYVISRILGVSVEDNPLLDRAVKEGLVDESKIDVIYDGDFFTVEDFRLPSRFVLNRVPPFLIKLVRPLFKIRPAVDMEKCVGCGECVKVCPKQAISLHKGRALINYSKCIFCMCCNEVCRYKAIKIERSLLVRLWTKEE